MLEQGKRIKELKERKFLLNQLVSESTKQRIKRKN